MILRYLDIFEKLKIEIEKNIDEDTEFSEFSKYLIKKLKKLKPKDIPIKMFFKEFVEFIEDKIVLKDEDEYDQEQLLCWAVGQSFTQNYNKNRKREYLPKSDIFTSKIKKSITPQMNSARGKIYENMALKIILDTKKEEFKEKKIKVLTQKRFKISSKKARIIDIFLDPIKTAIEVKSGRVYLSSHIREEIKKDSIIIKNGEVKEYWWMLFYGLHKVS